MKELGDVEKTQTQRVRKFHYVPPKNKTVMVRSFSNESNSPISSAHNSFDPEKAWSIRKDVSLSMTSPQSSNLFGHGFPNANRYASPKNNIYSRHTGHIQSSSNTVFNGNGTPPSMTWQSGTSRDSQLRYSKCNMTVTSSDEFDMPTTNTGIQPYEKQPLDHRKHHPISKHLV